MRATCCAMAWTSWCATSTRPRSLTSSRRAPRAPTRRARWRRPATSSSPACPRLRSPRRSWKGPGGMLDGLSPGKLWLEMSTTDSAEIRRLAPKVAATGATAHGMPGIGRLPPCRHGQHLDLRGRLARRFERALPVLSILGHQILHTGELGSASMLKVMTNFLCTVHLVALAEALTTCKALGLDMNTTYEAHPHLVGQFVRARDRVAGDPERQPRHRLHDGPRHQGRGPVRPAGARPPACRSSCRR